MRIQDSKTWMTRWNPNSIGFRKGRNNDIQCLESIGEDAGIQYSLF